MLVKLFDGTNHIEKRTKTIQSTAYISFTQAREFFGVNCAKTEGDVILFILPSNFDLYANKKL